MTSSARVGACIELAGRSEADIPAVHLEYNEALMIDAAVQGDTSAFAALYDRHLARVYRHCYYRTGNQADAEDLTQQTFLHAWQAIGRYRRGSTPFVAWLLTISHNLTMSHHRKARHVALTDEHLDIHGPDDLESDVLAGIAHDAVRNAILQLKPERQKVVVMRFIEGFSVSEVAAAIDKTDNYVRVTQHRALANLRHILEEEGAIHALDGHCPGGKLRHAVSSAVKKASAPFRRPSDHS